MTRRLLSRLNRRLRPLRLEFLERRDVPSFGTPQAYLAGSNPADIVHADFNGDGLQDIAVANQAAPGFVNVLLNDGSGGLSTTKSYPTGGSGAKSLAVSDVSGDGKLDLVVANFNSGSVAVLRGSGTGAFRRPITFPAGTNPRGLNLGDFNNDGVPDLALVTDIAFSTTASVLLGQGGGAFQLASSYGIDTLVHAVTVGDFNADGRQDLAVAGHHFSSSKFAILLGNGDGSFQYGPQYTSPTPGDIATADFDEDGDLDLAVGSTGGDALGIWLGNGNGTFQFGTEYAAGTGSKIIQFGNVDSDANIDIVVTYLAEARLDVFPGRGDGTFKPKAGFFAGINATAAAIADFTHDGINDLAVPNNVNGSGTVTLLAGLGSGDFPFPANDVGPNVSGVVAADLNGDGDPDFAVANNVFGHTIPDSLSIVLGKVGTGVQTKSVYSPGNLPSGVTSADFDNDGALDLAVSLEGGPGAVSVLIGKGDGTLHKSVEYPTVPHAEYVKSADLNGDDIPDLVVSGFAPDFRGVSVLLGMGGGVFAPRVDYASNFGSLVISDFDNDAILDLAVNDESDDVIDILLGNGDGSFQPPVSFVSGFSHNGLAVGDFNSDGNDDLVTGEYHASFITMFLGNGDGAFQAAVNLTAASGPTSIAVADLNGDGHDDIVTANHASTNGASILLGNGNGTFKPAAGYYTGPQASDVNIEDFNSDGHPDVAVVVYSSASHISVLIGNGDGSFIVDANYPLGFFDADYGAVADFDGDGFVDLSAANGESLGVLRGNGDGTFQPVVYYLADGDPLGMVAHDLNDDGRADLAVTNYADEEGTVSILFGTGRGLSGIASHAAGVPASAVAAADFNNDGNPDVAVTSPGDGGTIHVILGNGNGNFQPAVGFAVGANPLRLATGDFNSDGNHDIATANPASGTVSILLGNGNGAFQSPFSFASGSAPFALVVNDLNGDGIPDLAVTNRITAGTVTIWIGVGDGTFQSAGTHAVGIEPVSIDSGDFNGDSVADLTTANTFGTASVLLGNGDGTFQAAQTYAVGDTAWTLEVTDVDEDGWLDIAVGTDALAVLINAADWPPLPIGGGADVLPRRMASIDVPAEKSESRVEKRPHALDDQAAPAGAADTNATPKKLSPSRLSAIKRVQKEADILGVELN